MPPTITHRTRLAEILHAEGRKQVWLAEQIGVSRRVMHTYVNGMWCPEDRREAIAEALGRSTQDVFPTESGR